MSQFQRYAVYFLPTDRALTAFGAAWLGWDVETGAPVAQPDVKGIEEATRTPRKYGFHGTLKAPFRLAEGRDAAELRDAVSALAASLNVVSIDGLKLARLGQFLALVPEGKTSGLEALAFACVQRLDHFRRPAEAAELARRRASGLSSRQDALLMEWGYPYVADEFRFHMTLSGKMTAVELDTLKTAAEEHLPDLPRPFDFTSISLAGEREDGAFQLIERFELVQPANILPEQTAS